MIVRIVKMNFAPEQVETFLEIFSQSASRIRNFPGCSHLQLFRDKDFPNILFTYSYWDEDAYLQAYRNSELFKSTWAKTKVLFQDKPEAWSLEMVQ